MPSNSENIYKAARNRAGMTAEYAAECLNVNTRTLYKYEDGTTVPAYDIVTAMSITYGAPFLRVQHMNATQEEWRDLVPIITEQNAAISTLAFLDELNNIENYRALLVEIARDGIISQEERPAWGKIIKAVFELIKAGYDLKYSQKGEEKCLSSEIRKKNCS